MIFYKNTIFSFIFVRVLTASFLTIGVTIYSLNKENFGVGTNIIKCKNWLSILIKNLFNVDETKSFCQLNVYVPALVCDAIGIVYKALETSIFYDDIGSMGESEGAFSYKKHISSIKNMN